MLIPVLLIVLVTILAKDKEDYKWFVFHTALLNFFLGIISELTYLYEYQMEWKIRNSCSSYDSNSFENFSCFC
uniref:Uncharacterized protein n=1 Tax=Acrobeloides nanus TaxID=290746 RepID=A0A914D2N2_9BILA